MKLHLPKQLLVAVMTAAFSMSAHAHTGWSGNSLYIHNTTTQNVSRDGFSGEVIYDSTTYKTTIESIDASEKGDINIYADYDGSPTGKSAAEIGTLTTASDVTLKVAKNPWHTCGFADMVIERLVVDGGGPINVIVQHETTGQNNKVVINSVEGILGSTVVNSGGDLTIGSTGETTVYAGTISNSGTLKLDGAITIAQDGNYTLKGGEILYYSKDKSETQSANGFAYQSCSEAYLVDGTGTTTVTADTVTIGDRQVTLDKTSEAGKVSFSLGSTVQKYSEEYHVNESEALASNTASKYVLADSATMTWTDALVDAENNITVNGNGTVVAMIGTNGANNGQGNHNNKLQLGTGFNGILQLSKADDTANSGKMELCGFVVGTNATFKLMSGEHWSSGSTIENAIILGAENETDFTFNHGGTLTLTGKVTGSHLYSKSSITLTNSGTSIDNVRMDGGTLTISNTMNFGTVNAPTMEVGKDHIAKISTGLTGTRDFTKSGAGTLELNGSNSTYTGAITVNGGKVSLGGTNSTGTGEISLNNGSSLELRWGASINSNVAIALNGGSIIEMRNGGAGNVLKAAISVNESGYISGSSTGGGSDVQGTITGHGTLGLLKDRANENPWKISATISDDSTAPLAVEIYGGKLENSAPVKAGNNQVTISGANTYTGGTTIEGGTVTTANVSALGTGKVTMEGGTLKQASALSVSDMDYTGGTVNNNGQKFTVTDTLKAKVDMTIEGSGDTKLGALDLTAGTTLITSGSLTIGELILDLEKYADYTQPYNLVTVTGEGKSVTLTNPYTGKVDGYTYTVDGSGTNMLTLNFTKEPAQSDSLTTTVLDASLNGTMLTLTVDGDITSAEMNANIIGFGEGVLEKILGLTKGVEDGMIGITLVDGDATLDDSIVGNGTSNVGFYGAYYGAGNGQYFVQYIPEPATATLSLLALAGLAARRRRK